MAILSTKLLSPVANEQQLDNLGNPLSGGTISVYYTNTLTLATIYANSSGGALSNPIVLDSSGRIPNGQIYLDLNFAYDIVVKQGTTTLESFSNVVGTLPFALYGVATPKTDQFNVLTETNVFTLSFSNDPLTITASLNGIVLNPLVDYFVNGNILTTNTNLNIGDVLVVHTTGQLGVAIVVPNNLSGSINLSMGSSSFDVIFTTPEADANYRVFCQIVNTNLITLWYPVLLVNNKTVNGFNIRLSGFPVDNNYKIDWIMIR